MSVYNKDGIHKDLRNGDENLPIITWRRAPENAKNVTPGAWIKGRLKRIQVNKAKFYGIEQHIQTIMERGLTAALNAMAKDVGVDSGMSKASLMGKVEVNGKIKQASALSGTLNINVTPLRTVKGKSIQLGKKVLIARIRQTPKSFSAILELNVLQYFLHDEKRSSNYTSKEWGTVELGKRTFKKKVASMLGNASNWK